VIAFLPGLLILLIAGGYLWWDSRRPKVHFLRRVQGTWVKVGCVSVGAGAEDVRWKNRRYILRQAAYLKDGRPHYFVDADTGRPILASNPDGKHPVVSPDLLDVILEPKTVRAVLAAVHPGWTTAMVLAMVICAAAAAGAVGYVIGASRAAGQPEQPGQPGQPEQPEQPQQPQENHPPEVVIFGAAPGAG